VAVDGVTAIKFNSFLQSPSFGAVFYAKKYPSVTEGEGIADKVI
jgi:hypothetical protein